MMSYRKVSAIVSLVMLSLVFMNVFAAFITPAQVSAAEGEEAVTIAGYEMVRTVGGLDTLAGIGIMAVSAFLLASAFAIWNNRQWEGVAIFALIADITLKFVNIMALLLAGGALTNSLLAVLLIAIEIGLIGVLARRHAANRKERKQARVVAVWT